ncbi:MAG TPA: bacillithiol biosynthesis deacetylase BshB1 [Bacteroidota bacterium]|nr:bacillithiol biosynthesis deacetylase BshB1 [Bacteroidota bacterium]
MKLDILAIGAHPDDVELTCAGTLAKSRKQGYKTGIIDLTKGELGTRGDDVIRAKEAAKAAKILGCIRENVNLPDGNIEVSQANIKALIRIYRKYRPNVILIPHFNERHPDHVHAHHLCREAWFYSGLRKIRTTLEGKEQAPWRPDRYYHFMQWTEFTPSFIVDITDVYEIRLRSIRAHKSQFYDPRSKDPQTLLSQKAFDGFLETRAKNYGYQIGVTYGEPFYSTESIGIGDLFDLKMFKG